MAVSERLLSVGLRIPAQPNNEVTVPHAFFGPLPCRSWPLFQAVHDGMHIAQIESLKSAEGFPGLRLAGYGCGSAAATLSQTVAVWMRGRKPLSPLNALPSIRTSYGGVPPLTDQPISTVSNSISGVSTVQPGASVSQVAGASRLMPRGGVWPWARCEPARQHARSDRREDEREYPRGGGGGRGARADPRGAQARRSGSAQPLRVSRSSPWSRILTLRTEVAAPRAGSGCSPAARGATM